MAHKHSIHDNNLHFAIDPVSRAIANQVTARTMLMQFDHNSERLTFELPRKVDDHDMTECDKVEIHYINVAADKSGQSADVYRVDDMQVSPDSDDVAVFSWLISGNATKYAGLLSFLVRFTCLTGETIDYAWHTDIYSNISVGEGMNLSEAVLEEYSDILTNWERRLGLPFVTDADNGKVMRVVGGKWKAEEIADPDYILPDKTTPNGNLVKWDAENKKLVDAQTSLNFFAPERVAQKGQFLFINTEKGSESGSKAKAGLVFTASGIYDGPDNNVQDGYAIVYDPKTKTLRLGTGQIAHSRDIYTGEGEIDFSYFEFGSNDIFENEEEDEAIATRADNFKDGHIPIWQSETNMFIDSGVSLGDISSALDELHAYAQALIGGDA